MAEDEKALVRLDDDVRQAFPDSETVNEALRFLMRITKENQAAMKQL